MCALWNFLWECHLAFSQSFFIPGSHQILLKTEHRTALFSVSDPQVFPSLLGDALFQPGVPEPQDRAAIYLSRILSGQAAYFRAAP